MTLILDLLLNRKSLIILGIIAVTAGLFTYHEIELRKAWNSGYKSAGEEAKSIAIERQLDLEKRLDDLSKMPDDELRCSLVGGVWKNSHCAN